MNIVFFGSSQFAVPSLKALHSSQHKILCVVTQPDRRKGRGLQLACTPVKEVARELNVNIYQPLSLDNAVVLEFLKNSKSDLFVVISYGKILSKTILSIPAILSINLHASLLPKYRGAAPINWAIIKGEEQTGITIIEMNEKMDEGKIIMQRTIGISEEDTAATLEEKLANEGSKLLLECLDAIENNCFQARPQDAGQATYAPKLTKNHGLIDWSKPAADINNLVRGCYPWPGAFTYYKEKILKILGAKVIQLSGYTVSGQILQVSKNGVVIATGKDGLKIEQLQLEGKRVMSVKNFIAGHKIKPGEILGK